MDFIRSYFQLICFIVLNVAFVVLVVVAARRSKARAAIEGPVEYGLREPEHPES